MAEPIRTCLGCRQKSTKYSLTRLVRNQSGDVSIDTSGKGKGRGVYVCLNKQCIELALIVKRLNKALRTDLKQEEVEIIKEELLRLLASDVE